MTPSQFHIDSRHAEFVERLLRYFDGKVTPEEVVALNEELANCQIKRRIYIELSRDAQMIHESPATSLDGKITSVWFGDEEAEAGKSRKTPIWRRAPVAIAATLALLASLSVGLYSWHQMRQLNGIVTLVDPPARLVYTVSASWNGGQVFEPGYMSKGSLRLDSGLAMIQMKSGASIILEGPADFEIVSAMEAHLRRGTLAARVPKQAHGFSILTEAVSVRDLGTAFGVTVGASGETDVAVFDGRVAVYKPKAQRDIMELTEGKAIRARIDKPGIESIALNGQPFERVWALASGILSTENRVQVLRPGQPREPFSYGDDRFMMVFPEAENLRLREELRVDISEPGIYRTFTNAPMSISAGSQITSYLIQLNPDPYSKKKLPVRLRGKVTFSQPVVGIVVGSDNLRASDGLVALPVAEKYEALAAADFRGLDGKSKGGGDSDEGVDIITLSEDRQSLTVRLSALRELDQVRVFVRGLGDSDAY